VSEREGASTLPDLTSAYPLSPHSIRAYRDKGHTVLRGLASVREVQAFAPAIAEVGEGARYDRRPLEERDTYGRAFQQMPNLWVRDARVKAFVFAERFARVAAELMGVEGVRLYHDQALSKEPGGGYTPWHQDRFYWPLDTPHTITMWMPLVDVSDEVGSMTFVSGSQRLGSLGDHAIGDASQQAFQRLIEERGLRHETHGALAAGDATFHDGWTLHCAPANPTATCRQVMTVIYFADGARVGAIDHPAREFDYKVWLRGCEPGGPAAGELNPLLYRGPREHGAP